MNRLNFNPKNIDPKNPKSTIQYVPGKTGSGSTQKVVCYLSQAAACDGTTVTTSAAGQEYVPGTLPIY